MTKEDDITQRRQECIVIYLSFAYDAVKGNYARREWVESKQEPKTRRTLEQIEGKRKKGQTYR